MKEIEDSVDQEAVYLNVTGMLPSSAIHGLCTINSGKQIVKESAFGYTTDQ